MVSQITGVSIVFSALCSDADQWKHQSSASLAFVRGIYRWPVNSPHKGPVTWKNVSNWWRHHDNKKISKATAMKLSAFIFIGDCVRKNRHVFGLTFNIYNQNSHCPTLNLQTIVKYRWLKKMLSQYQSHTPVKLWCYIDSIEKFVFLEYNCRYVYIGLIADDS